MNVTVPSNATNTTLYSAACNGQVVSGGALYHGQFECPMHGIRLQGGFEMRPHDVEKIIVWPR